MKFKTLSFIIVCATLICSCKTTKNTVTGETNNLPELNSKTEITVRTESVKLIDQTNSTMYRYYVIIGSFRSIDNARQYNNDMQGKGFASTILESENGLYRISAGGYDEENAARAKIAEIRAKYDEHSDVWLLVSK